MNASKTLLLAIVGLMASGVFSAIQYRTCSKLWKEEGCKIDRHRNLSILQDDRQPSAPVKIDWDNKNGYVHDLSCRCREKAVAGGYKWFAIEKNGICLSQYGTMADYISRGNPLDDANKCGGILSVHSTPAPDGSACMLGVFRVYFYTLQSAPIQGSPGAGGEEEAAAGEAPAPNEEEKAAAVPKKVCQLAADVILIIDMSGSVGEDNFKIVKNFTLEFMDRFDFNNGKSRVAIITYNLECHIKLRWSESSKKSLAQLKDVVRNLPYLGGSTMTQEALRCAKEKILAPEQRPNIKKTIFVMTDGQTWGGESQLTKPAQDLRNFPYECTMVALGIGDYNIKELKEIVGPNAKADSIITKESFKALGADMGTVLNTLVEKACVSQ